MNLNNFLLEQTSDTGKQRIKIILMHLMFHIETFSKDPMIYGKVQFVDMWEDGPINSQQTSWVQCSFDKLELREPSEKAAYGVLFRNNQNDIIYAQIKVQNKDGKVQLHGTDQIFIEIHQSFLTLDT